MDNRRKGYIVKTPWGDVACTHYGHTAEGIVATREEKAKFFNSWGDAYVFLKEMGHTAHVINTKEGPVFFTDDINQRIQHVDYLIL